MRPVSRCAHRTGSGCTRTALDANQQVVIAVHAFTLISTVAVSQQLLHWAHPLLRIGFTVCCGIGAPFIVGFLFGMFSTRFLD